MSSQTPYPSPGTPPNTSFTIGWICLRSLDTLPSREMLDQTYGRNPITQRRDDKNAYNLGRIGRNNIVMAVLPADKPGRKPSMAMAAQIAADMKATFPNLKHGVLVTTGSGIPSERQDVRLGDVVVGTPDRNFRGVVRFEDVGAEGVVNQVKMGTSTQYSGLLVNVSNLLAADRKLGKVCKFHEILLALFRHWYPERKEEHLYQGSSNDRLFDAGYKHVDSRDQNCMACDLGTIASSDYPVTDPAVRQILEMKFGAKAIQVGDRNEHWDRYASAAAAAYARELLLPLGQLH
ncbi:hypothetical protein ASPVEDRAFT_46051 [Aspergillus versicolor CBS 583.65]|uniref:Nucleoside phosphorylase domain-containing protein n=1 Tax=Aspergillus versicolor CBS 583.65 TaxID=1036611 RepID=A0A1L9PYX1_ASPVE|nr:uncharacterized protein ASPVEDRAFT_46051 [Aspergillus versicolor CBS 583.65]OJJ06694.1 hypothetical protein ASPVEDRAFT_46051 [Aspergillus versicolor CBS 583.65]